LSKVLLPVKTATHKIDYLLCILDFSATSFLVNFFQSQVHLHLAIIES